MPKKERGISFVRKADIEPLEGDPLILVEFECDKELLAPFAELYPIDGEPCGKLTIEVNGRTGRVSDHFKVYQWDVTDLSAARGRYNKDHGDTIKLGAIKGHVALHHSPLAALSPKVQE